MSASEEAKPDRKAADSPPILVSACLLGETIRYHGGHARCEHPALERWLAEGRVLSLCPEVAGGLPTPRPPSEVADAAGGEAVLAGRARVIEKTGGDVTAQFLTGARLAQTLVREHGIRVAILKEGSPTCGSSYTHDGRFLGVHIPLPGVTTAMLLKEGVRVFSEAQLDEAAACVAALDRSAYWSGETKSETSVIPA